MSNPEFVHLHTHSYYSLLDGLSSIQSLVKCAKSLDFKSLALTDHGSCAGLYNFQKECLKQEIKPILGMEAYMCPDRFLKNKEQPISHLVLLAKNKIGYKNLIYLSSMAYIEGFYYKQRIDFDLLEKHKEGLIVTSACVAGEIPKLLWAKEEDKAIELAGRYKDVFGDDFYIEIMTHKYFNDAEQEAKEKRIAAALYKLAKKIDVKAICTTDIHYARKEEWKAQDVLLSIQTLDHIKNPKRLSFGSKDFYMKSAEELAQIYSKAPELLSHTVEIAEKIESKLICSSEDLMPSFDLPEGFKDEVSYLKALVTDGMKQKGLIKKSIYRDRIRYEIDVITKCNYTKYFLVLWDIINFAKTQGIRIGPGRGSAVSSLCLYVLGITKLDPIKYELLFERFLNPDRISPPDVDIDFDYDRREEVYNYIVRKYGSDHCSQIGTYNKYKAKAVIRSTVKALDLGNDWEQYLKDSKDNPSLKKPQTKKSLDIADSISKQISLKSKNIVEAMKSSRDFRASMQRYPELLDCVRFIEGVVSSAGVHPAGILVCKDPVIEHVPLRVSKGVISSQFDGPEVEHLGLLKFDLLALRTLTVVDKTLKMIKKRHPNTKDLDLDLLEPNDKKVFAMLNGQIQRLDTRGVFQYEGDGISKLLANIRVDTFEDMIVANALYRPGPLGAGVHDMYCSYKHGRQDIQYLHPKMATVLKKTYGIMVFQEDIMKVAVELAGFTGPQSDTLRKAMGKKLPEVMAQQKELFVSGCIKNNISKEVAEEIFKQIDYFSGYGFNRCLSGRTTIKNKIDDVVYTFEELANGSYGLDKNTPIVIDSYLDGEIVEDDLVEVFETGEKEVYAVELDNGTVIESTLDHKFLCSDGKEHTVQEIMNYEMEILYDIPS